MEVAINSNPVAEVAISIDDPEAAVPAVRAAMAAVQTPQVVGAA